MRFFKIKYNTTNIFETKILPDLITETLIIQEIDDYLKEIFTKRLLIKQSNNMFLKRFTIMDNEKKLLKYNYLNKLYIYDI